MRRSPGLPRWCQPRKTWRWNSTGGCACAGLRLFPAPGRGCKRYASRKRNGTSLRYRKAMKRKAVVQVLTPKHQEQTIAPLVQQMLALLGENPDREGLQRTPERVDKALRFLTSGYRTDLAKVVN